MDAEIIAVGSELLTPQRIDTNSLYLTDQLNALGIEVVQKSIVGDDRSRLIHALHSALQHSRIVVLTGGLGPTEDDVTRDAVAAALNRGQVFRQDICDAIEQRFRRMKRQMVEINRRQAFLVEGAEVLPNSRGTAPGQWLEQDGRVIVLLPGPPNELTFMFEEQCLPRLRNRLPQQYIRSVCIRVAGMPESDLDQLISPVYKRYGNPVCTILASAGDIQVHLRARCDTEGQAESLLSEVAEQIEALLGDRMYTRTGQPLEERIGDLLRGRQATLCVAESCTGGLLAGRITDVPGSSDYFRGGFVTYTNDVKSELLGVPPEILRDHGAVSEETAKAMASGARVKLGTTYAVSITGIAGPDGGSEETPVGTVIIGFADETRSEAKRLHLPGDRERVRTFAAQMALDLIRRKLSDDFS
jgi:nicotinamide-nucleotide amidase